MMKADKEEMDKLEGQLNKGQMKQPKTTIE